MLKVCILTSAHSADDDRIFYKQARSLARAGYQVTLIVPHEREKVRDGVRIKAVRKPSRRVVRMTRTIWEVYREAVHLDADLYHFHDPELIPAGLLLQAKGKKVIFDIHENVPNQILQKDWIPHRYRKALSRLENIIERFVAKRFSAVVTAGTDIAEKLDTNNKQTVIIQNYAMLEEFPINTISRPSRYTSKIIVSFGGISSERAIRELVSAMYLLPKELGTRLILGGNSVSKALEQEVAQMPGWERVKYLGMIPRQEMVGLLAIAQAAIVLYSPMPNNFNVRSNRFFDSIAAGLPVITSNFPKWREVVEGNGCGLTVDPKDPKAIAAAIEYLLTHPEEAGAMGRRGREAVEKYYNWENEERKLRQLYAELVGPP